MTEGSRLENDQLHLPARSIPHPFSISAEARAALAVGAAREPKQFPDVEDVDGWRKQIAAMNDSASAYLDAIWQSPELNINIERLGEVDTYVARRKNLTEDGQRKINFHIHGGGWVYFGGRYVVLPAAVSAMHYDGVVYAVDYRTPPDHPYPAALDDCLSVYQELLKRFDPASIFVSGDSAGGNLAGALMHRARDLGLPAPCALFLNTPASDLTHASDSLHTNKGVDVVLSHGVGKESELYCNGADARSPYLSPLLGDLSKGFPPTYIRTGTRDVLLSDSVRMHAALRKAGVEADLYVGEAMPHGGFAILGSETVEDIDAREDLLRWLAKRWPGPEAP